MRGISILDMAACLVDLTQTAARKIRQVARRTLRATDHCGADRGTQLALAMAWPQHLNRDFRDVEFRNFSQNGEDGILLYLFSLIGHGNRRAVELCAGDGIECNSANLIVHHDWDALLLDGNPELIAKGREFYSQHQETSRLGPTLAAEWITVENVNQILTKHGYDDAIDFLSLDMDGVDYWILEAIQLRPRLIVVEYNNRIPADKSVTVPYKSDFATDDPFAGDGFFGASLAAFDKLLDGYRLVGANRHNTNAFFLRDDVLPDRSAVPVASCLTSRWAQHQQRQWPALSGHAWVEV